MKKAAVVVVVMVLSSGVVLFGASKSRRASTAGRQFVGCPLEVATTTVTNPLPRPWWTTPQRGRLREVRVEEVGGRPTLMCGYWAYSTTVYVMREPPKGTTCTPEGNGFSCN